MRKKVSGLILCFALLFALPLLAFAANQVNTMDIQTVIYEDRSMYVTQVWEGDFNEGTESYIPMNTPDYLTISQLTVSDQNGSYETVSDWNIDWSFEEKARKCGMQGLREYLAFYNQNQILKDQFVVSERIDFGLWDTKIIFDYQNKLFCMSKNPDKTVFEGKQLKSFTIREDNTPLFEGSAAGIRRYASTVPERAMAMAPQIAQFAASMQMARTLDRLDDGKVNNSAPVQYFDIPEPFQAFNVELHFDHPYWTVLKCDMDGPRFNNTLPDVNNYLRSYQQSIEEIEKLAAALRTVAFPGAAEQSVGPGMMGMGALHTNMAPPADAIEEIKKYKALMEDGVLSQQEFEAKKKQLLGI